MTIATQEILDGAWEKSGYNPMRAGIAGLLITGALYSAVGGLVLSVIAIVISSYDRSWVKTDNFVSFLLGYYQRFQVPILLVTAIMEFVIFLGITLLLVRRWHSSQPLRYLLYRRPLALDLVLAGLGAVAVV